MTTTADPTSTSFSLRLLDVDVESHFNPISGLDTAPLVSLREAMQIASKDEEFGKENLEMALSCAEFFAEDLADQDLSLDEVAVINLYTQESPFYRILNSRLRNRDRQLLKPFLPLFKLMITALQRLPPLNLTVYRGVKLNLLAKYQAKKGKKEVWWSFGSTTDSVEVLQDEMFLGKSGDRSMFIIAAQTVREISRFSAFSKEKEYLVLPGTVFIVDAILDTSMAVIQLRESGMLLTGNNPSKATLPLPVKAPEEKEKPEASPRYFNNTSNPQTVPDSEIKAVQVITVTENPEPAPDTEDKAKEGKRNQRNSKHAENKVSLEGSTDSKKQTSWNYAPIGSKQPPNTEPLSASTEAKVNPTQQPPATHVYQTPQAVFHVNPVNPVQHPPSSVQPSVVHPNQTPPTVHVHTTPQALQQTTPVNRVNPSQQTLPVHQQQQPTVVHPTHQAVHGNPIQQQQSPATHGPARPVYPPGYVHPGQQQTPPGVHPGQQTPGVPVHPGQQTPVLVHPGQQGVNPHFNPAAGPQVNAYPRPSGYEFPYPSQTPQGVNPGQPHSVSVSGYPAYKPGQLPAQGSTGLQPPLQTVIAHNPQLSGKVNEVKYGKAFICKGCGTRFDKTKQPKKGSTVAAIDACPECKTPIIFKN